MVPVFEQPKGSAKVADVDEFTNEDREGQIINFTPSVLQIILQTI